MTAGELLVVGLDLTSGLAVHASERAVLTWHKRGWSGDRTLVCAMCFAGEDGAAVGTKVPLVVKGRVDGERCAHFAHPPFMGPPGGHHPETVWHISAKAMIAAWAWRQQNVREVTRERWTQDRTRRSDVQIVLNDGSKIAVEVQAGPLTDFGWCARHDDYVRQGIKDVWLWRPALRIHMIVAAKGCDLWQLNPARGELRLLVGEPHDARNRRGVGTSPRHERHAPPCVGDIVTAKTMQLADARVTSTGIEVPAVYRTLVPTTHAPAERSRPRRDQPTERELYLSAMLARHFPDEVKKRALPTKPWRRNGGVTGKSKICKVCKTGISDEIRSGIHILC